MPQFKDFNAWAAAQARADAAYAAAPEGKKHDAYRAQIEREKAAVAPHQAGKPMADKVQTEISITRDAHTIVQEYADERGLNFSHALENVIREWALIDRPADYHVTDAGRAAVTASDIDYDDLREKEQDYRDEKAQARRPL